MKRSNLLFIKLLSFSVIFSIILQLTSCGTLLYPERRGQTGGRIDPAIAVMDGIGVLFFVIPGLIAFAVDFYTGAIYFPPGTSQVYPIPIDEAPMVVIHEEPENLNMGRVEKVATSHTGRNINLNQNNVRIYELRNTKDISTEFAKFMGQGI